MSVAVSYVAQDCIARFVEHPGEGWQDSLRIWSKATGELYRVEEPEYCEAERGWYQVIGDPNAFVLCPASCAVAVADELQVTLGCATLWRPPSD